LSTTLAYIVFGIVLLHIVVGFAWLIYKFSKPSKKSKKEDF
jgi:hypothetical protein